MDGPRAVMVGRLVVLALAVLALLAGARALPAQGITDGAAPRMIWNTPPLIGMYSPDSARVDDSLPIIASADWPASADTAFAELRRCTRLRGAGIDDWQIRTVASAFFGIKVWHPETGAWETDTFLAFTFPHVKRIYVVQRELWVRGLVKHEMLHALLAAHGFDPRHDTPVADGMFRRCFPEPKP